MVLAFILCLPLAFVLAIIATSFVNPNDEIDGDIDDALDYL